jgi:hypothetical protein
MGKWFGIDQSPKNYHMWFILLLVSQANLKIKTDIEKS